MKHWSRGIALAYLMFLMGSVFALQGRPHSATLTGLWTWIDCAQVALAVASVMVIGFLAGLEQGKGSAK